VSAPVDPTAPPAAEDAELPAQQDTAALAASVDAFIDVSDVDVPATAIDAASYEEGVTNCEESGTPASSLASGSDGNNGSDYAASSASACTSSLQPVPPAILTMEETVS
jgi:hypothetical protein